MSFSGSESYSGLCQPLEMELLTFLKLARVMNTPLCVFLCQEKFLNQKVTIDLIRKKKGLPQLVHL